MPNEQRSIKRTMRKVVTWIAGFSTALMLAACLQIAGIDPPILDPIGAGGSGGSADGGAGGSGGSADGGAGGSMGPCQNGTFAACYSGPMGTLGVGSCTAGQKICINGTYSPCAGDVVPTTEDCATLDDEDCDGDLSIIDTDCLLASSHVSVYGTPTPATSDDSTFAVVATADDGYVAGGFLNGTLNSDAFGVMTGNAYVSKFAKDGKQAWTVTFSTDPGSYAVVRGLAVDKAGDIIAVGTYNGTMSIGVTNFPAIAHDSFIAKISPVGDVLWKKSITAGNVQLISAVVTDIDDNIYVTGSTNGAVDFGGGMSATPTLHDAFVVSYDGTGAYRWDKLFVNPGTQIPRSLAVIPNANNAEIVIVGDTDDAADLGGGVPLAHGGGRDVFIARYSTQNGAHNWSKTYGDAADQYARAVAVDPNKDLLITGEFVGEIDWGGGNVSFYSDTVPSLYAVKLTPNGVYKIGIDAGVSGKSYGTGIGSDANGNVVVCGHFDGEIDWDGMNMKSATALGAFVVKLAPVDWKPRFGTTLGGVGNQYAWGVASQSGGAVTVFGAFDGALVAPPNPSVPSVGGSDSYAVYFAP